MMKAALWLAFHTSLISAAVVISPSSLTWDSVTNVNSFTVALSAAPVDAVSVAIGNGGDDYTTLEACSLTFTPENWNVPQQVGMLARQTFLSGITVNFKIYFTSGAGSAELAVTRPLNSAAGRCVSWGDPHYTAFNGDRFNFFGVGDYYMLRAKDSSLVVQTRQGQCGRPGVSCNFGVAFKYKNTVLAMGMDPTTHVPILSRLSTGPIDPAVRVNQVAGGKTIEFKFPEGTVKVAVHHWKARNTYYLDLNMEVPNRFKTSAEASGLCHGNQGDTHAQRSVNLVHASESLFAWPVSTIPVLKAPVILPPTSDPDNYAGARSKCTAEAVPEPGSKWHSKKLTQGWRIDRPSSPAEYKRIFLELDDGHNGWCSKTVRTWNGVSNRKLCGSRKDFAVFMGAEFETTIPEEWCFRLGADLGLGGAMYVDNELLVWSNNDMWWANRWTRTNHVLKGCIALEPGIHQLNIFGMERCCDGAQKLEYSKGGEPFTVWSADTVPSAVAKLGAEAVEEEVKDVTDLVDQVALVDTFDFGPAADPTTFVPDYEVVNEPMPEGTENVCSDFFLGGSPMMTSAAALGVDLNGYVESCETDIKVTGASDGVLSSTASAFIEDAFQKAQEQQSGVEYWQQQKTCQMCSFRGTCGIGGVCSCSFPYVGTRCAHTVEEKPEIVAVSKSDETFVVQGKNFFAEEAHYCVFGANRVEAKFISEYSLLCEAPVGNQAGTIAVTGNKDAIVEEEYHFDLPVSTSYVYHTNTSVAVCSVEASGQQLCFENTGSCTGKDDWKYVGYSAQGVQLLENLEVQVNGKNVSWTTAKGLQIKDGPSDYCTKPLKTCRCIV